jgi:hypothetical protein
MSEQLIQNITLDYLINKELYKRSILSKETQLSNKKDKKFYRRRVLNLTKQLLLNETPELPTDIYYCFNQYVKSCIQHFKLEDTTEIFQDEYISNTSTKINTPEKETPNTFNSDNADNLIIKTVNIKTPTLDNFVKTIKTKKEQPLILPQKKEIDLRKPEFKIKGISKKNNITKIYTLEDGIQNKE